MSDIANDNGEPAWSKFLAALVTEPGEEPTPEPEPEPEPETSQ